MSWECKHPLTLLQRRRLAGPGWGPTWRWSHTDGRFGFALRRNGAEMTLVDLSLPTVISKPTSFSWGRQPSWNQSWWVHPGDGEEPERHRRLPHTPLLPGVCDSQRCYQTDSCSRRYYFMGFLSGLHFCKYRGISKYDCMFTLFKQFVIDQRQRAYTAGQQEGRVCVVVAGWS